MGSLGVGEDGVGFVAIVVGFLEENEIRGIQDTMEVGEFGVKTGGVDGDERTCVPSGEGERA